MAARKRCANSDRPVSPRKRKPHRPGIMNEATTILLELEKGDAHVAEQLLPLVYEELRKLASQKL